MMEPLVAEDTLPSAPNIRVMSAAWTSTSFVCINTDPAPCNVQADFTDTTRLQCTHSYLLAYILARCRLNRLAPRLSKHPSSQLWRRFVCL